jgi:hypothetical protein
MLSVVMMIPPSAMTKNRHTPIRSAILISKKLLNAPARCCAWIDPQALVNVRPMPPSGPIRAYGLPNRSVIWCRSFSTSAANGRNNRSMGRNVWHQIRHIAAERLYFRGRTG